MEEQSDHRSVGDAGDIFAFNDLPALALTRFNSRSAEGWVMRRLPDLTKSSLKSEG